MTSSSVGGLVYVSLTYTYSSYVLGFLLFFALIIITVYEYNIPEQQQHTQQKFTGVSGSFQLVCAVISYNDKKRGVVYIVMDDDDNNDNSSPRRVGAFSRARALVRGYARVCVILLLFPVRSYSSLCLRVGVRQYLHYKLQRLYDTLVVLGMILYY